MLCFIVVSFIHHGVLSDWASIHPTVQAAKFKPT